MGGVPRELKRDLHFDAGLLVVDSDLAGDRQQGDRQHDEQKDETKSYGGCDQSIHEYDSTGRVRPEERAGEVPRTGRAAAGFLRCV